MAKCVTSPSDYSTYRHLRCRRGERARAAEKPKERSRLRGRPAEEKRKLTFKEKREMESLEKEIEELTAERATLETSLSTGGLDSAGIITAGERLAAVVERLDEAELRLLELMDI